MAPAPAATRREHPFIGLQRRIGYTAACSVVQRKAEAGAAAESLQAPPGSADVRDAAEKRADLDAGVGAAMSAAADPLVPVTQLPSVLASIKRTYGMISLELTPTRLDPGDAVGIVAVAGRVNPPKTAEVAVSIARAGEIAAAPAFGQSAQAPAIPPVHAMGAEMTEPAPDLGSRPPPCTEEQIDAKKRAAQAKRAQLAAAAAAGVPGGLGAGADAGSAAPASSSTQAPAGSFVFPQPSEFWFGPPSQRQLGDPGLVRRLTPTVIGTRSKEGYRKEGLVQSLHRASAQNQNVIAEGHAAVAELSFNGVRQYAYHSTQSAAHAEQNLAADFENALLRYRQRQPTPAPIERIHISLNLSPCGRNPYLRAGQTNKGCADLLVDLKNRTNAGGNEKIEWSVSYGTVYRIKGDPQVEKDSLEGIARLQAAGIAASMR